MGRRGMLAGAWALSTAAATLVAWGAVHQVTDQVSPPAALPLPAEVAQRQGRPAPEATQPPAREAADGPVAAGPDEQQPPPATARTEAYDLVGGVVTVRYRDGATTLVEATPNTGFDVDVHDGGPQEVEVRFRSDGHESRFRTRWRAGAPQPQREERPR